MKKIYFVLTYTGTVLSKIIKLRTRNEFSHVSISLDKELNNMYSFGRKNPYNPFFGGFIQEYKDKGTFKRFKNTKASIYSLEITDEQYEIIKDLIAKMQKEKNLYKFNVLGLFAVGLHIKLKFDKSFYCAEFVKFVLEKSKIENELPEIIKPEDFRYLKGLNMIYSGFLKEYKV